MRVIGLYEVLEQKTIQPDCSTGTRQPPIFRSIERTTELSHSWWRNRVDDEQADAGQEELRGRGV